MAIVLYHHPYSRAANSIAMLEEVGCTYETRHIDIMKGEQKAADIIALNPMGKLPILVDDGVVVTESAAIGLYLADRYSPGKLAPALDDPARATYLRWSLFAPSVIETGCYAKQAGWDYKPGSAGWGTFDEMLAAIEAGIGDGPWVLGDRFSMADLIFGGTVQFMLQFKMLPERDAFTAYAARLSERPSVIKAGQFNAAAVAKHMPPNA